MGRRVETGEEQWDKKPTEIDRGANFFTRHLKKMHSGSCDAQIEIKRQHRREEKQEEASFKRFLNEKEAKQRRKRCKTQKLCSEAFASGDAELHLKRSVIATLRTTGKAEKVFRKMDKDNSGHIDVSELKESLTSMGYNLRTKDAIFLMRCMDRDGDGKAR